MASLQQKAFIKIIRIDAERELAVLIKGKQLS